MARITLDVDDALLGEAAHALGTTAAEATVVAALQAAVRGGMGVPPLPRHQPSPTPPASPLDPPLRPQPPSYPHPPEIH